MNEGIEGSKAGASRFALAALAVAALLAACGGGRGGVGSDASPAAGSRAHILAVTVNPNGWVAVTQPSDALMQNLSIPADAPARGMWSAPAAWPMVGLHQAVLPDGKVLTWGTTPDGNTQNGRYFDLWDPNRGLLDAGAHNLSYDATRQDSFCAPSVYTGDGRLMITGGNGSGNNGTTSQYYTPSTSAFAQGPSVADARWYAATKGCRYLVTSVTNKAPTVSLTAPTNNASVRAGHRRHAERECRRCGRHGREGGVLRRQHAAGERHHLALQLRMDECCARHAHPDGARDRQQRRGDNQRCDHADGHRARDPAGQRDDLCQRERHLHDPRRHHRHGVVRRRDEVGRQDRRQRQHRLHQRGLRRPVRRNGEGLQEAVAPRRRDPADRAHAPAGG